MRTRSRSISNTLPSNTRSLDSTDTSSLILESFLHLGNLVDHRLEVRRQRRIELDPAAVGRVSEAEARRVQERTLEAHDRPQIRGDPAMHAAVHRVADDGVADGVEVDAYLVSAPGGNRHFDQRHAL